jgi:heme/copper-type cytochrome/quinol oxidase subunit 2
MPVMNRTNALIWFIVLALVAAVAPIGNPILSLVVGAGAIAFLIRFQNSDTGSAWAQSRFVKIAVPIIAVLMVLGFVYVAVVAIRIAANFGPVR